MVLLADAFCAEERGIWKIENYLAKDDPSEKCELISRNDLLTIANELYSRLCYNFANSISQHNAPWLERLATILCVELN